MVALSGLQSATRALRLGSFSYSRSETLSAQLSSGKRINTASDDAAGLSISTRMEAKLRSDQQAARNVQDGVSLLQTAGGALDQAQLSLQRLRELAVTAANDTLTDSDRSSLQQEADQLRRGLNDIAATTQFNGHQIFNESTTTYQINQSWNPGQMQTVVVPARVGPAPATYDLPLSDPAAAQQAHAGGSLTVFRAPGGGDLVDGDPDGFTLQGSAVRLAGAAVPGAGTPTSYTIGTVSAAENRFRIPGNASTGTGNTPSYIPSISAFKFDEASFVLSVNGTAVANDPANGYDIVRHSAGSMGGAPAYSYYELVLQGGSRLTGLAPGGGTNTVTLTGTGVQFGSAMKGALQVASGSGASFALSLPQLGLDALKLNDFDLQSQTGAEGAITQVDDALATTSSGQSSIGSQINALSSHLNVLGAAGANSSEALSHIQDLDVAQGVVARSREEIIQSSALAGVAMARDLDRRRVSSLLGFAT